MFAGAGLSLSAGYPYANALAGLVGRALGLEPELLARHSLAQLFEVAEEVLVRDKSHELVGALLSPPLPVEPTPAHIAAVQRFEVILTYDNLFEGACAMLKIPYKARTPWDRTQSDPAARVTIFKIDGTMDRPESLVLTPADVERARADHGFWEAAGNVLSSSRPIFIGHSMRDANSRRLMEQRDRTIRGIYVAPVIDPIDGRLLLSQLNLEGVESTASEYLWRGA